MKKSKEIVKNCRMVVMGASGVGKTSLISQFLGNGCPERHEETVEEMYHTELRSTTMCYNLEILDTTGTYSFPAMKRLAISKADVFILVFAMDSPESLQYLKGLREEILGLRNDAATKIVVVSNKAENSTFSESFTSWEQTAALVSLDWDCHLVQTSAKTNSGVMDLFQTAVSLIKDDTSPTLSPASSIDECPREC